MDQKGGVKDPTLSNNHIKTKLCIHLEHYIENRYEVLLSSETYSSQSLRTLASHSLAIKIDLREHIIFYLKYVEIYKTLSNFSTFD